MTPLQATIIQAILPNDTHLTSLLGGSTWLDVLIDTKYKLNEVYDLPVLTDVTILK